MLQASNISAGRGKGDCYLETYLVLMAALKDDKTLCTFFAEWELDGMVA